MPITDSTANAYLTTKVLTASPEEVRLMLLDGAIKFCQQGRDGLAAKNYEACHNGFSRCRDILLEMINCLRPELDSDLCAKVSGVYTFMYTALVEAGRTKDVAKADKVLGLLHYERETWVLVMDKLAQDKSVAGAVRAREAGAPGASTPTGPRLSVSG